MLDEGQLTSLRSKVPILAQVTKLNYHQSSIHGLACRQILQRLQLVPPPITNRLWKEQTSMKWIVPMSTVSSWYVTTMDGYFVTSMELSLWVLSLSEQMLSLIRW